MKKCIIIVIIFILIFCVSIFAGKYLYKNIENSTQSSEDNSSSKEEIIEKDSHIKQRDELATSVLYDYKNEDGTSADDLIFTDMTMNASCELYHKIITNEEDYNKYNSRFKLPEIDFEKYFIVIVANEKIRDQDEVDMTIYKVISDETTTHIIMKQKQNPHNYSDNNVFYAVVDKSELRENADVTIEYNK